MKTLLTASLFIFGILISGCEKKEELPKPEAPGAATQPNSGDLASAPAGYLSAAGKAVQSMEKTIDVAAVNNALQLFGVQEGRNPESLNELVEKKYLSKLPALPFGSKLHYDKNAGKVSVIKE